jgi:galactoside O-acetyltransferase
LDFTMQTGLPFAFCGEDVRIYDGARITQPQHIALGSHVMIDDFVFLGPHQQLTIGNYIHLSSHLSIVGGGKVYLSDFSGYSTGVRILSGTDDFSGAGLTNSTIPPEFRQVQRSAVWVGPHVAIGANVVILPGVCIGEGAAVVAGSVVSRDLPPWGLYGGWPARRIKPRPSDRILQAERALLAQRGAPPRRFIDGPEVVGLNPSWEGGAAAAD